MKKLIFITLLSLLAVSGWGQNYVRLGDAIAITPNESDLQKLELTIDSIHLVLPEGMQDSFKVFDFSYYIFNEFMVGLSSPAIWDEKIIQVSSISKYFILFGREYNKSDEKLKWRVKIKLPEGSEYRCSNPEQFQIIENYLISSLNSNNILATNWSQAEINELKHAKIHINKLYNCCDANRTSCDSYDILNIDYLSGILKNYEFTELKEITFLFNGSYLGKAGLGHRSGSFFSEQSSFLSSLSNAGLSGSFQNIFLQIHTVFKHNEGAPPKITQDNWNLYSQIQTFENYLKTLTFQPGLDYKEQNIIIYHDGKYRVFTRISRNINWDFTSISSDEKDSEVRSAIIPALIARWVVKKIWQAGVGIVIGFTVDVVVEKYFTYDHDCNWGSAIRYTFQKTEPYKYLLWAAESWLDSSVSAVFMGAMTEGASYLFTVSDGGFSFDTLFDKMLYGGLQGFFVSGGLKGISKVFTQLSNELNVSLQKVKDDFAILIKEFLIDSGVFRYWKISTFAKRTNWKRFPYIYKAGEAEVNAATEKIKTHRKIPGNNSAGNWGYLEGNIEGFNYDFNKMWRSVSEAIANQEIHIYTATEVKWMRITDSEYRMLNKLAHFLGAKEGDVINGIVKNKYPNIKGEIKIVSENEYCPSCQGIIQQFYEMFPKIKIILIDGAK
jgi:hypothetical protein